MKNLLIELLGLVGLLVYIALWIGGSLLSLYVILFNR